MCFFFSRASSQVVILGTRALSSHLLSGSLSATLFQFSFPPANFSNPGLSFCFLFGWYFPSIWGRRHCFPSGPFIPWPPLGPRDLQWLYFSFSIRLSFLLFAVERGTSGISLFRLHSPSHFRFNDGYTPSVTVKQCTSIYAEYSKSMEPVDLPSTSLGSACTLIRPFPSAPNSFGPAERSELSERLWLPSSD